ncbi:MAG: hypothetical protein RR101_14260 [Burkholderiaceae bacterium]
MKMPKRLTILNANHYVGNRTRRKWRQAMAAHKAAVVTVQEGDLAGDLPGYVTVAAPPWMPRPARSVRIYVRDDLADQVDGIACHRLTDQVPGYRWGHTRWVTVVLLRGGWAVMCIHANPGAAGVPKSNAQNIRYINGLDALADAYARLGYRRVVAAGDWNRPEGDVATAPPGTPGQLARRWSGTVRLHRIDGYVVRPTVTLKRFEVLPNPGSDHRATIATVTVAKAAE